jgi:DNA-binding response OmpR family regulator
MKTILIIEGNSNFLDNLTEYFEREGFNVIGATNGRTGIDIARKSMPDLIICDFFVPVLNGLEVLTSLLSRHETYNIPFIYSTSMPEKKESLEAIKLGADKYFPKPYHLEVLLATVKNLIKSGSKRKQFLRI